MKSGIKIGVAFLIFILAVSCSENVRDDSGSDSLASRKAECVPAQKPIPSKEDSAKLLQNILKNFLDTQTQFVNANPRCQFSENRWPFLDISDSVHNYTLWFYEDGKLHTVTDENKRNNITANREYYENGKLKTSYKNGGGVAIDSSFYFSENGALDSAIDNNKKYKINYYDAMRIAKKHWPDGSFYIDLETENNKTFWQVTHTTGKEKPKNILLRIDVRTGKEKFSNTGIYTIIFSDANGSSVVNQSVRSK